MNRSRRTPSNSGGTPSSPEVTVTRIPVTAVEPVIDCGRYAAKAIVGEDVAVAATVFREGHDQLGATVVLTDAAQREVQRVRMRPGAPGTDRFHATLRPSGIGLHTFTIESWSDPHATWVHAASVKIEAGVDVELMLQEGVHLFRDAASRPEYDPAQQAVLTAAAQTLADEALPVPDRLAAGNSSAVHEVFVVQPLRDLVGVTGPFPLDVQRRLAGAGSWYEFFPRSEGARFDEETSAWVSGTFQTASRRLPEVAAMGFDVVYLPPIHPIGTVHRKGRNNSLTTRDGDPGSPWAIGSADGGHDAIHPELGTEADFADFVSVAAAHDLEIALDLALQCAPDHPWVQAHPEWFTQRADGSIAYAENPPKKYQDIYPLNFDRDPEGLSAAVLKVVQLWVFRGVKIFRVDNPHTKPLWFWEWLIARVRAEHPEVVFLAEAFTRPAMMHALGRVGFQQSYSYFTWRNSREELANYLAEVTQRTAGYYRPNFFVNTPDILTEYLQFGGPAAFKIRAVLAALSNPLWGVYAGFELYEHVARPGAEEYIDNEKYEYRPRDFAGAEARGQSLAPYLRRLNEIRRAHPALQQLQNLTLHEADTEHILVFSKTRTALPEGWHADAETVTDHDHLGPGEDTLIVVVNVDPHTAHEATVRLDLNALGLHQHDLDAAGTFDVEDLITGARYHWGDANYVRLDPFVEPAHVLHVIRRP
ncbi:alpha-1,4-glucan--maltose-1-phosphate maltosyltransferase [Citricoccus sp. NR2]|uniref:alpha-1,4-glucan--maltose-1-phosphate maltosyltransferase n=1 Tax=Citricoccus sp. NR2 TaxID=3004095 RepID=UPI003FA44255